MNLFRDPWIAVQGPEGVRLIGLGKLLCADEDFTLCLPRDDMELSTLQLAICLTQVAVLPESLKELKDRIRQPMSEGEYQQRTESLVPWFQMDHPEWPFMQTTGVTAKEVTPIQKLLPGLPEGNNHSFFNSPGEVKVLGAPMVAVALFQQATMTPSFGGGFKNPLRGSAPMTTLVWHKNLRQMVWHNVLFLEGVEKIIPNYSADSEREIPTWVSSIKSEENANSIGLLRGLFWQPAHVKISWESEKEVCDLIGVKGQLNSRKFDKEQFYKKEFYYSVEGTWPHPHSPRSIERGFMSFRTQVPSWTQCHAYVYRQEQDDASGHIPAAVVSQAHVLRIGQELQLIMGGYCNKAGQANILERRFELLTLGVGWDTHGVDRVKSIIKFMLESKKELLHKLITIGKKWEDRDSEGIKKLLDSTLREATLGDKVKFLRNTNLGKKIHSVAFSLAAEAERSYYQETEPLIRQCLQTFTFKEAQTFNKELLHSVEDICMKIYDDLTKPFEHDPGMMASIAIGRRSLGYSLRELITPSEKKQTEKKEVKQNVSARKK
ncbi:MAG: type I-E CRISPR-associated protein Cse1/CasA [Negativicutes bacterium]